ncbi:uncharacterized protein C4orf54 homolog [Pristis pectinata]|uniref:uncharacterized protein C4orf54 homolog n=1 Tax=Pristis pectinata TaxID=685728 RepID=UPI00223DC206|nr:uncharacterized protein C4orf54 homolog [Pristis pectinata]
MLRLHLSLAAARSAAVNGSAPGTGESLPRAPGAPRPTRPSPASGGVTANGDSEPGRRRRRRKGAENGGEGSVPGAKREAGGMVRKGQSPGASRRICADAEESQADESDHSGYDTAAGYSDFYESFSECAESPPSNGDAGTEDCAGDLRSCLGSQAERKEPVSNSGREGSSSSSALLWDQPQPSSGDEAHYISTHEIQLYELDHDGESALGAGWDAEESSACYSCRDSSSFESDASEGSSRTPLGTSNAGDPPPPAPGTGSPARPVAGARSASPPECGNSGGRFRLSIRADSRAVSEGTAAQERGNLAPDNFLGPGNQRKEENMTKLQTAGDGAQGASSRPNVPPGAGVKSNWKAFGNSSGTSSAVSELDDADKEVRSLTARTFRSLACAGDEYLDTFSAGYRTSTDLSSDEMVAHNRCATYIDLKCRNTAGEKAPVEFPTKSAKLGAGQGNGDQRAESTPLPAPVNERQAKVADKQTSRRQLHLSGKFEQIGSRVITLTETLNFRYDVKEHTPARREGERRVELARAVVGSRCADEVTEGMPREEAGDISRGSSKAAEAMEGAQKKSKFASNLLQNVIWKKMQFEQELKMERGEISDTSFAGRTSPPAAELPKAPPPQCEVEPNSSGLSGGSAETSPVPPGENGGGEPTPGDNPPAPGHARPVTGEPADGCKGTLPRSQHSAFRSWKEGEQQTPGAGNKPAQRVRAEIGGHPLCKETKMSHLFVPSIQKAPGRSEPPAVKPTTTAEGDAIRAAGGDAPSRSPEIKIRLRNVKGGGQSPFSIAKLLTPKLAGGGGRSAPGAAGGERAEDGRARAPPFTVRDVRDNIHKLQAPIHQVRDVRKLVKSSYHVLTLDGGGSGLAPGRARSPSPGVEQPPSLPIVIKCQAVSRKELPGARAEPEDAEPAAKNGAAFVHRASGRLPLHEAAGGRGPGGSPPAAERRGGGARATSSSNRLALEKLTAAVRTMEQLYVFDNNEWRRKNEAGPVPGSLAGSHVLSLIASEEGSGSGSGPGAPPGGGGGGGSAPAPRTEQEPLPAKEAARVSAKPPPVPAARSQARDPPKPPPPPVGRVAGPQLFAVAPVAPQPSPLGRKAGVGSPPDCRPLREQPRPAEGEEKEEEAVSQQKPLHPPPPPPEHENYLTIPVKKPPSAAREPSPPAVYQHQQAQLIRLTPPALEPLSPGKVQQVPPVLVDSPSVPCFPVPQTQRRMLLDPATGQYYLVDTPVQPARRRLYDPETGQYVDVPLPQQPVAPMPMPMSPIAISPGTYGPTYMIYPGFLPPPTVLPTLPPAPDTECSETGKGSGAPRLQAEPQYLESPYYFPTGKSLPSGRTTTGRGCKGTSEAKPLISITSQQGPRIIAPPSFDGTTMSFVVEHR